MANPRSAWGIDIGNRALKAVKLVREGETLRVDDFEFIEHETILSQAGDNRESLIQTALGNFVQRHNFKNTVCSVGVSGQNSFARFVKLPPIEEKKIPEIVRFEAIQQIPFPLEDVEWSYQLFRQPESPDVEVGIFAMRRELVNLHIKYFTDFDLNVQNVQMNPLAVYNALAYDGRFNDGTAMIIDVGADNTDLLIANNDSIWMRSIPIGGSNFTETLVKTFKLSFAKAEELKRNAATSKYARQIFQAMRPVFADLVAEIQRSMGFYSSVNREVKIAKVYSLGGTFKLPGLQKYLQQNLQLPVERLDSLAAGAPTEPKAAATFGDNLLSIFGAYGLAVQAMGGATVNSSLLPRAIQRERMWQEKNKWFATAAAICLAGTAVAGGSYFFQNLSYENAQDTRLKTKGILDQAQTFSKQWAEVQDFGTKERAIIENLKGLNNGKWVWRDLLADISTTMPQATGDLKKAMESGQADLIKKIPRDKRQIFQIDTLTSTYDSNLGSKLASGHWGDVSQIMAPGFGGVTPTDPNAATAVAGGRGYVVVLKLTSPYADCVHDIETTIKPRFMSIVPNAARPNLGYAVKAFEVMKSDKFSEIETRKNKLRSDYQAFLKVKQASEIAPASIPGMGVSPPSGEGFSPFNPNGVNPTGAAGAQTPADDEAFKDRLTGESMMDDYEIDVKIAVILDPEPYKAPEGTPAPQASTK